MRRILFLLLLLPFSLFSKESVVPAFEGEPSSIIHGCVDVITGAFFQNETDMIVEGPESIQLTRSYNSWDDYPDPTMGSGWRFNIPTTFHSPDIKNRVFVTEDSGSLVEYCLSNRNERRRRFGSFIQSADWKVNPAIGLTNTGSGFIGSETNRKNNKIHFFRETKHKSSVDFTNSLGDRTRFYLREYPEKNGYIWPVEYTQKINGNRLNIHLHKGNLLRQVLAHNPSKGEIFGKVDFFHQGIDLIEVKGSNGQWVKYRYGFGNGLKYLKSVESSHQAPINYKYGGVTGTTNRIIRVRKSDKQELGISYYQMYMNKGTVFGWFDIRSPSDFRVGRVYSLSGMKDGKLTRLYAFRYLQEADGSGNTLVIDSENNRKKYFYSKEKRLKRINYERKGRALKAETFYWGEGVDKGNLMSRCIHNDKDQVILCQTYTYDLFGNVLEKKLYGNLTGEGHPLVEIDKDGIPTKENQSEHSTVTSTYRTEVPYSKLSETDDSGIITRYTYHPTNHQIASKEVIDFKGRTKEKTNYRYNENAVLTESYETHEKETLYQLARIKTHSPGMGKAEFIEKGSFSEKKRYPLKREKIKYGKWDLATERSFYNSKNQFLYKIDLSYDSMGRVIKEVDSRGKTQKYQYNKAGNLISQTNPDGSSLSHKYNSLMQCIKSDYNKQKQATYEYDLHGKKTAEVDFYGNKKLYSYDSLGKLYKEEVEGLEDSLTHYTHDTLGNRDSKKDAKGVTRIRYTVLGKPYLISYPDGSKERYVYTKWGDLKRKIERNGSSTVYTYDSIGRCVKEERCGTNSKAFAVKTCLYKNGHLAWEKDEEGKLSEYSYDIWGNLIREKIEDRISEFTYDRTGRLSMVKSPYLEVHKTYDTFDRLIREEKKEGKNLLHKLEYAYDLSDKCIKETKYNENGPVSSFRKFDLFSREIEYTDEKGHKTSTAYNNTETVTDALGRKKVSIFDAQRRISCEKRLNAKSQIIDQKDYLYDCQNNKIQETHRVYHKEQEDHRIVTKWIYGSTGNLEALIEAAGTDEERKTRFIYKNIQLIKKIKPNGIEIEHRYNPQGRVSETFSSDKTIHYRYSYSPSGRPLKVENLLSQKVTERSYDVHGSIIEDLSENNQNVSYRYDKKGRCTQLTLPDISSIHYGYNGLWLKSITRGSHTHTYDKEDLSGRVLKETHFNKTSSTYHYNPVGQKIEATSPHYSWHINEFDPLNRLIAYESTDPISQQEHQFAYDDCDQIISEKSFKNHQFNYDSRGNRLSKDDSPYKVNFLDELIEFSDVSREYLNGNLIQSADLIFAYDAWDRMISSEKPLEWRVEYQYDAFNRRLSKKTYSWQSKWIEEKDVNYIYQDDIEIASENDLQILGRNRQAIAVEINKEVYTPIYDRSSSMTLLLDLSNTVISHNRYTAFGEFETYGLETPWVYSNKRLDEETGFIFFGRRYYEPITGRWTSQDPLGFADGPNLYAYVHNDPLRFIDYEGLTAFEMAQGTAEGAAMALASFGAYRGAGLAVGVLCPPAGLALSAVITAYTAYQVCDLAYSLNETYQKDGLRGLEQRGQDALDEFQNLDDRNRYNAYYKRLWVFL